jgi:DNA-binding transcriptional LysR family regulator
VVTGNMIDLNHSDIDCAIRFGRGKWPGVTAERIGGERYSPVVAPMLADSLRRPEDLRQLPLIRDTASMLPWEPWFDAAGIEHLPLNGPVYDDPALAFDAAISGQGVLMAVDLMSADAVSDGRLARPFATSVVADTGYWFVTAEGRRLPKKVKLFRDWLLAEVPDSLDGYVAQMRRAEDRPA